MNKLGLTVDDIYFKKLEDFRGEMIDDKTAKMLF
jgi:hypothetical protein